MVLMEALDQQKRSLILILLKQKQKFCLRLHYIADNSYLFANGKEIFKFKTDNENVNFPTQFCHANLSNGFSATDSSKVSLNGNVYDFSVDYKSIDKSNILKRKKTNLPNNNYLLWFGADN